MCKTYGITNNKRHGMGAGDKVEINNSADEGGEPLFEPFIWTSFTELCSEVQLLHQKKKKKKRSKVQPSRDNEWCSWVRTSRSSSKSVWGSVRQLLLTPTIKEADRNRGRTVAGSSDWQCFHKPLTKEGLSNETQFNHSDMKCFWTYKLFHYSACSKGSYINEIKAGFDITVQYIKGEQPLLLFAVPVWPLSDPNGRC